MPQREKIMRRSNLKRQRRGGLSASVSAGRGPVLEKLEDRQLMSAALPGAPSGFTATPVSAGEIDLTWTNNAPNATTVRLFRSTDGLNWTVIDLPWNTYRYDDTNLTDGSAFDYRVRAIAGTGKSAVAQTSAATLLPAPINVMAAADSSNEIDLSWTIASTQQTGFNLLRSTDGVNFTYIASVAANATTYSDTSVNGGTTYYYRVRAVDSATK
jgi:hypothetical protein